MRENLHSKPYYKPYNIERDATRKRIDPLCNHVLKAECAVASKIPECGGVDIIEACVECGRMQVWSLIRLEQTACMEDIIPQTMCKGPDETILVWDNKREAVLQFSYDGSVLRYLQRKSWVIYELRNGSGATEHAQSMCYAANTNTLVVLSATENDGASQLRGFNYTTGDITWQYADRLEGSHLCYHPQGYVFVANAAKLLVIDARDGSFVFDLMTSGDFKRVSEVVCTSYNGDI